MLKEVCEEYTAINVKREALPTVLDKYKKSCGEKPGIMAFTDNWDSFLNQKTMLLKYIDVIGCFLPKPPYDTMVSPCPNYRKYLERSGEHVNSSDPETKSKDKE